MIQRHHHAHYSAVLVLLFVAALLFGPAFPALAAYQSSDVLGQPDFTTGTPNTATLGVPNQFGFSQPDAVAIDGVHHRLFVTDGANNRVLEFDLDTGNNLVDHAADHVLGQTDFVTSTSGLNQNKFNFPFGLTYDPTGNRLFVVDQLNERVMVFDVSSIIDGEDAINVLGQTGYGTATTDTTQSTLNNPIGLGYDDLHQRLFVADSSNARVLVFDVALITNGENAVNVLGQPDFTTVDLSCTSNRLVSPYGLVYDANNERLFATNTSCSAVFVFDVDPLVLIPNNSGTDGPSAVNILGQVGSPGVTRNQFEFPTGVAYDSSNERLFVSEGSDHRVTVFDVDPGVLIANNGTTDDPDAINVIGQPDFTTGSFDTTQQKLKTPYGVAYDDVSKHVFVPEIFNNRLTIFNADPLVLIPNNSGTDGPNAIDALGQFDGTNPVYTTSSADNQDNVPFPAVSDRGMNIPTDTLVDTAHHRLFVADSQNNRILEFDLDLNNDLIDHVADHVLGQADFSTGASGTTDATFNGPTAIAYDPSGDRLFVSDFYNNRVMVFDTASISDGESAVNVLGQTLFTTASAGSGQAGISAPNFLAYDTVNHRLFVADASNARVMVFDVTSITNGEDAVNLLGHTMFDGSDTPTDTNGVAAPAGMAYDAVHSRLFVGDGALRVMVFDVTSITNGEDAVNLLGHTMFDGSDTPTDTNGFGVPEGMTYDPVGDRLFVTDDSKNRVTIFDTATITNGEDAVAVLGQDDFTTTGANTTQNGLSGPTGIGYDPTNKRAYIADAANNRVIIDDFIRLTADTMPGGVIGTPYSQPIPDEDEQGQITFSIASGSLPPGLSLDGSSGQISGTPTTLGTTTFTVRVEDEDDYGVFVDERSMSLTVYSSGGYLASDAIGQLDSDGNPLFTASDANGGVDPRGFNGPFAQEVDAVHHRLFVADGVNNRVLVFDLDSSNQVVDYVADFVLGQDDFKSVDPGTSRNTLSQPRSLAYDSVNNRLFVGDYSNGRVLIFDASTISNGMDAANVLGYSTFDASDIPTDRSQIRGTAGLAYDEANQRLFVSDFSANRVVDFDLSGGITNGMDPAHVLGQADYSADDESAAQNRLRRPGGLAYDPTRQLLFVADNGNGSFHNRVMIWDVNAIVDGEDALHVLGHTTFDGSDTPTDQNRTQSPYGLAYDDANQRLFVGTADISVRVFDLDIIVDGEDAINVLGQPNFTDTAPATTAAGLSALAGLSYDSTSDSLFVSDFSNNRIMIFDVAALDDGEDAVNVLGQYAQGTSFTAGAANNAPNDQGFYVPFGVALDFIGHRLFASDTANNRVLEFDLDTNNNLIDHTADHVLGQPDFKSNAPAGGAAGLSNPFGVAYDAANQRLLVVDPGNGRVVVFDVLAITNGEDAEHFITGLSYPRGIAYDPNHQRFFVADLPDNRVLVFDADPGTISDGESPENVLGQPNFSTTVATTTISGLHFPADAAYDSVHDRLFVGDEGNSRVMVWDLSSGTTDGMDAAHVLGQNNFNTAGYTIDQKSVAPIGVAYDAQGDQLFVVDSGVSRVMVFDVAAITDGEDATGVLGQVNFTDNGGGFTSQATFYISTNTSLTYDSANNRLYLSAVGDNRILIYDFVRITTTTVPDATVGQAYNQTLNTINSQGMVGFSLHSGTLPPGLAVDSISGTPTTPGVYTFTVRATDDNGGFGSFVDDQTYTMTVNSSSGGGGGGNGGGGGVFLPGPTPSPSPTPFPSGTPFPTPNPLVVPGIVINDGADRTNSRFVKLTMQHPFSDDAGVSMRIANPVQLSPEDQRIVAIYTVGPDQNSSRITDQANQSGGSSQTPELSSGLFRTFKPTLIHWDVCSGATVCPPGEYRVYAQFYRSPSATTASRGSRAAMGDEVSLVYTDTITYGPSSVPPAGGGGGGGGSGPVVTPVGSSTPTPLTSGAPLSGPGSSPLQSLVQSIQAFLKSTLAGLAGTAAAVVPFAAPVLASLSALPLVVAGAAAAAASAGGIANFAFYMGQTFFEVVGLKRKTRVWGTIYDAKTKYPIAYAKVELRDQGNRVLETRYADRVGRYGFLTSPATLHEDALQVSMVPGAKEYVFPSQLVTADPDFIVYNHIYRGGLITITKDVLVNYNIPLDPATSRPLPSFVGAPLTSLRSLFSSALDIAFWVGLIVLPINAVLYPSLLTVGLLVVFLIMNGLRVAANLYRPFGVVTDAVTKQPLSYALVTLNEPNGKRITFAVSDEQGRYFLLAEPGSYLVTAYTPANISPQRSQSSMVTTKKGWLTRTIAL